MKTPHGEHCYAPNDLKNDAFANVDLNEPDTVQALKQDLSEVEDGLERNKNIFQNTHMIFHLYRRHDFEADFLH